MSDTQGKVRQLVEDALMVGANMWRAQDVRARADAMDAQRTWPHGDEAAQQLAEAFNEVGVRMIHDGEMPDALKFDAMNPYQREYALQRAAAVLARLHAPEPDAKGE